MVAVKQHHNCSRNVPCFSPKLSGRLIGCVDKLEFCSTPGLPLTEFNIHRTKPFCVIGTYEHANRQEEGAQEENGPDEAVFRCCPHQSGRWRFHLTHKMGSAVLG